MEGLKYLVPMGLEIGSSTCKFSLHDMVISISSVVGNPMTEQMEASWRVINLLNDGSWIKNLAIFDEKRQSWYYVSDMTKNSESVNWFCQSGSINSIEDAYLIFKAGLFLCYLESYKKNQVFNQIVLCLGLPASREEGKTGNFHSFVNESLKTNNNILSIRAKNAFTGVERVVEISFIETHLEFQTYGTYFTFLKHRFANENFNTFVIDIGHESWTRLPIVNGEAFVTLFGSEPDGISSLSHSVRTAIYEASQRRLRVSDQGLMKKIEENDFKLDLPEGGELDFKSILNKECESHAQVIVKKLIIDIKKLMDRDIQIDFFAITGGGSFLLGDLIKKKIQSFFGWDDKVTDSRILFPKNIGIDPRYTNCIGFMLLGLEKAKGYGHNLIEAKNLNEVTQITTHFRKICRIKKQGKNSLLIVDFDKESRIPLEVALSKEYNVYSAENGKAALNTLQENSDISLVITDFSLPLMSGVELAREIRAKFVDIQIFLITGQLDLKPITEALNEGTVSKYFTRPLDMNELLKFVKQGVDQLEVQRLERENIGDKKVFISEEVNQLTGKLGNALEQSHKLLSHNNDLRDALFKAERQIEELKKQAAVDQGTINDLKQKSLSTEKSVGEKEKQMSASLAEAKATVEQKEDEVRHYKDELSRALGEKAHLESQIRQLLDDHDALLATVDKMKTEIEQVKNNKDFGFFQG